MDFAGAIRSWDSVVRHDCVVRTGPLIMTEEFQRVLLSIPSSDNGAMLAKEITEALRQSHTEIELDYQFSKHQAIIKIVDGQRISTMNIQWGTKEK